MAEATPPGYLEGDGSGPQHPARLFRRAMAGVIGPGVANFTGTGGDLKVTQNSPTAMSVIVAKGGAFVKGTVLTDGGLYFVYNDGNVVKTISANSSGSARVDLIVAKIRDNTDESIAGDDWIIDVVTGTPGAGVPATPASSYVLAQVAVANGASTITNANITDMRARANPSGTPSMSSAHGARIYRTGTNPDIANNTLTVVTYNAEFDDTDGYHSTSSNTSRITIPAGLDGIYDFSIATTWIAAAGGIRQVTLLKNGGAIAVEQEGGSADGNANIMSFNGVRAVAGDYFEVQVKQTAGGGVALDLAHSYYNMFSAWLRGA